MNEQQFQHKCYKAYQLQWMLSHGETLTELANTIIDIACETMAIDDDYTVVSSEKELRQLMKQSYGEFIDNVGFCGSLFVCEDEFLQAEYLTPCYMFDLLSQMADSTECKKLWTKFTGLALPDPQELQQNCEYHMPIKNGKLNISTMPDSAYPGLDIEYESDKDASVPDDTVFTKPRVLIENNENVLRAIIWGDRNNEDYSNAIDFTCTEDTE